MKKPLLVISLLIAIVYACNQSGRYVNSIFTSSQLSSELFSVDITKDTLLQTKKGALIKIPQGALSASGTSVVQLEIKEAYSMEDIIRGGLVTQSNGQPLSSGGMIYINAVGENTVKITKAISVAIPTPSINPDMQLFKGEQAKDSSINWTDAQPMPENPQMTALNKGKVLFDNSCASCHSIGQDMTGPDLAHIVKRSPKFEENDSRFKHNLLYEYTRNNRFYIGTNEYYTCLYNKWNNAAKPLFPNLTDEELDNLYAYIENESEIKNLPVPDNGILACLDSCTVYFKARQKWEQIKEELEIDSSEMINEKGNFPINISPATPPPSSFNTSSPVWPDTNVVNPMYNKSLYYQFTIESFGWYNIDVLFKADYPDCELAVRIQGQYRERFNIYLAIPDVRAFLSGGPLKDATDSYGFYKKDGTIPLPQNVTAYIIAMGEYEDQIIFAKQEFTTSKKQELELSLTTVTKEVLQQEIASLKLEDITIRADDTKIANDLRKAVRELEKAEQLKPKNCNCDCFQLPAPTADSSMKVTVGQYR